MRPPPGIDMPNGGVNYEDGILFCAQGSAQSGTGGIYFMPRGTTAPKPMVTNFHGRDFNSVNDIVVAKDGCIWFTDPCYGHEQDFRQKPKLPNQVYRYNPKNGDLRVVADGFGRPNGIAFSPDESIIYITDTDLIHGDGTKDLRRYVFLCSFCRETSLTADKACSYLRIRCHDYLRRAIPRQPEIICLCGRRISRWHQV
jgi:gluconolactonase